MIVWSDRANVGEVPPTAFVNDDSTGTKIARQIRLPRQLSRFIIQDWKVESNRHGIIIDPIGF